jgi:hypothetical protein
MKTLRWTGLSSAEQDELRNLVKSDKPSAAWVPDYDWLGFMILAIPAAIAATIALHMQPIIGARIAGFAYRLGLKFGPAISLLHSFLYLVPLALAIYLVVFLIRNWKCRGYAVTSFGTVKVCGPKLKLMRHDEVASAARRVIRSRKNSFTVFELFDRQGKKFTFYTTGNFADAAIDAINRKRNESASLSAA